MKIKLYAQTINIGRRQINVFQKKNKKRGGGTYPFPFIPKSPIYMINQVQTENINKKIQIYPQFR